MSAARTALGQAIYFALNRVKYATGYRDQAEQIAEYLDSRFPDRLAAIQRIRELEAELQDLRNSCSWHRLHCPQREYW